MYGLTMPVEAIEELLEMAPTCDACNVHLQDVGIYDGHESYYCESCLEELVSELKTVAESYAKEECRFTSQVLPSFNPLNEWKCTPEEYESGDRESNTENAFWGRLRHCHTNYEELIKPLNRDLLEDQVYYWAIRSRIDEMIEERIFDDDLIRFELDDEFDSN